MKEPMDSSELKRIFKESGFPINDIGSILGYSPDYLKRVQKPSFKGQIPHKLRKAIETKLLKLPPTERPIGLEAEFRSLMLQEYSKVNYSIFFPGISDVLFDLDSVYVDIYQIHHLDDMALPCNLVDEFKRIAMRQDLGRSELITALLGVAGSGKTTILKKVACEVAKCTDGHLLPVFLPLARFNRISEKPMTILDLIVEHYCTQLGFGRHGEFMSLLQWYLKNPDEHRIVFLFDGFDEIGTGYQNTRGQFREKFQRFVKENDRHLFVVSSRFIDPYGDFYPNTRKIMVSYFDEEHVLQYAKNIESVARQKELWNQEARKRLNRIVRELEQLNYEGRPNFFVSLRVPVMVNIAIKLFMEKAFVTDSLVELMKEYVNLISGGWQIARSEGLGDALQPKVRASLLELCLADIAYASLEKETFQGAALEKEEMTAILYDLLKAKRMFPSDISLIPDEVRPEVILEQAIDTNLLHERRFKWIDRERQSNLATLKGTKSSFEFGYSHELFQTYFSCSHLANQMIDTAAEESDREDPFTKFLDSPLYGFLGEPFLFLLRMMGDQGLINRVTGMLTKAVNTPPLSGWADIKVTKEDLQRIVPLNLIFAAKASLSGALVSEYVRTSVIEKLSHLYRTTHYSVVYNQVVPLYDILRRTMFDGGLRYDFRSVTDVRRKLEEKDQSSLPSDDYCYNVLDDAWRTLAWKPRELIPLWDLADNLGSVLGEDRNFIIKRRVLYAFRAGFRNIGEEEWKFLAQLLKDPSDTESGLDISHSDVYSKIALDTIEYILERTRGRIPDSAFFRYMLRMVNTFNYRADELEETIRTLSKKGNAEKIWKAILDPAVDVRMVHRKRRELAESLLTSSTLEDFVRTIEAYMDEELALEGYDRGVIDRAAKSLSLLAAGLGSVRNIATFFPRELRPKHLCGLPESHTGLLVKLLQGAARTQDFSKDQKKPAGDRQIYDYYVFVVWGICNSLRQSSLFVPFEGPEVRL